MQEGIMRKIINAEFYCLFFLNKKKIEVDTLLAPQPYNFIKKSVKDST